MARGVNKVILLGNVGNDPEFVAKDGFSYCKLTVATSESWKDKSTGEKKQVTEWHNVTLFNKLAEICAQYVKKGTVVYVEGKLKTDKYEDKNGIKKSKTSITADVLNIVSSKNDSQNGNKEEDIRWSKDNMGNLDNSIQDDDIPF